MTLYREDLFDFDGTILGINVTIADGKKLRVLGKGTVKLSGMDGKHIQMLDAMYVLGLDRRLLSVGKLAERGLRVEFQQFSCVIWGKNKALAMGKKIVKAFVLDCKLEEARFVEYAGADNQWELWHARMGHTSEGDMVKTQHATYGMPALRSGIKTICSGCMKGKQTESSFPSQSISKTPRVLELNHTMVMVPMQTLSKRGTRYVLAFVDNFSRFVDAYLLRSKSEVAAKLAEYKICLEKQ